MLRGLLDRLLLVGGVIAGGTLPSFVAQYRQRLGGALDQARLDLAPFQQIADRQFGGDLSALIAHHLRSTDSAFHAEGQAIETMQRSVEALSASLQALDGDLFHQLAWLATHADPALARATWDAFVPAFSLTPEGLAVAAAGGLGLWIVFQLGWTMLAWLFGGWRRTPASDLR